MSDELDLSGGDVDESRKPPERKRDRDRRKPPSEAELRKRIEDGIDEVVEFIDRQLGWDDVAATIRDDRSKMAEVLAARATRHARLASVLARVFGRDSALAIARAFGPTVRTIGGRLRNWRDTRAGELEDEDQTQQLGDVDLVVPA